MKKERTLLLLLALLLLLPAFEQLLPSSLHLTDPLRIVLVMTIVGCGLHLISGVIGILHLGIAGSMAIGSYTYAVFTAEIYPFQLGFFGGVLAATLMASIVGVLLATPVIRLRGDYIAIVTLGFGEIVQDVLRNLEVITKGTQGINPLPGPQFGGLPVAAQQYHLWYFILLLFLITLLLLIRTLERSARGRRWRAIREDELAARSVGIHIDREKLLAFGCGSACAGLGGALWAALLASSGEPANFDFQLSILLLSAIVVGGFGSTTGVLVGSLVVVGFTSVVIPTLSQLMSGSSALSPLLSPENWKYAILGLALILCTRFRPQGLTPEGTPP